MNHIFNERTTELVNGLFDGHHGLRVAGLQRSTDSAVVGEARLAPCAGHDRVFRQRVRSIIQIGQMLQAAHDRCEQLAQFRLGRKGARLLLHGNLHHPFDQAMLLHKLTESHQQAMLGVSDWPIRRSSSHWRSLHEEGYSPWCRRAKLHPI